MAKRKKFPKPLHFNSDVLDYYKIKFLKDLKINFFSNKNIYVSESCAIKNIPYLLGEFNGICINEWAEEKEIFDVVILSYSDVIDFLTGEISPDLSFVIKNINDRQTLVDEQKEKVSANIYIILESDFLDFYSDRFSYLNKIKEERILFIEQWLYKLSQQENLF